MSVCSKCWKFCRFLFVHRQFFFWCSNCCWCFSFIWYVINFHRAVKDRNKIIIFRNETLIRLIWKSLLYIFVFTCVCVSKEGKCLRSMLQSKYTLRWNFLLNALWNFRLNERRQKKIETNSLKRECHKSIFIIWCNTRVRDISVDVRTPFSFSFLFFSSRLLCISFMSTISSGHYRFTTTLCALHRENRRATTITPKQMAMAWYIGEQNRSN